MDSEIRWWFPGFEAGLAALPKEERGTLLRSCAENCLQMGMLDFYRGVHERTGGEIDAFFQALGEMGGLGTEIVRPGKEFWLIFHQCTCSLHTQGYINSRSMMWNRQSWAPFRMVPSGSTIKLRSGHSSRRMCSTL